MSETIVSPIQASTRVEGALVQEICLDVDLRSPPLGGGLVLRLSLLFVVLLFFLVVFAKSTTVMETIYIWLQYKSTLGVTMLMCLC